jgi:hypothetical protein
MARTEYYVDPSIAADSGTGTVGDPYGDLQYALDQVTRDATNGDRFNIKAGSDETLTSSISLATYGTPTRNAALAFQGYTSAAGDGGEGGISGNGSVSVFNSPGADNISFIDLHLHNTGFQPILNMDDFCFVINCRFDNSSGTLLDFDNDGMAENCYFTNGTGIAVSMNGSYLKNSVIENDAVNKFSYGIQLNGGVIEQNIIKVDGATSGIRALFSGSGYISQNTIWSDSGTGTGVEVSGSATEVGSIGGTICAGFSSAGGRGLFIASGCEVANYTANAFYDNETDKSIIGSIRYDRGGDVLLTADPFTDPSNGNFEVDTTLKALGFPSSYPGISTNQFIDIGAAQREEPTGGGGGESSCVFAT